MFCIIVLSLPPFPSPLVTQKKLNLKKKGNSSTSRGGDKKNKSEEQKRRRGDTEAKKDSLSFFTSRRRRPPPRPASRPTAPASTKADLHPCPPLLLLPSPPRSPWPRPPRARRRASPLPKSAPSWAPRASPRRASAATSSGCRGTLCCWRSRDRRGAGGGVVCGFDVVWWSGKGGRREKEQKG